MMRAKTRRAAAVRQRGLTLIGLLFWGILVAVVALVVIRVLPTINEYTTIQRAVKKIAQDSPGTVPEARKAFDRQQRHRVLDLQHRPRRICRSARRTTRS